MPFSRGLPDLGLKAVFPVLQAGSLPAGPLGEALQYLWGKSNRGFCIVV